MLLEEIARVSLAVAGTSARSAKVEALADCLRNLRPEEVPVGVTYLSGTLGRIGVGWASLQELPDPAEPPPTLELLDVDAALRRIAATDGPGSQARRKTELTQLFASATEVEQRFLVDLLHGELRQGALEGVMVEAVARAAASRRARCAGRSCWPASCPPWPPQRSPTAVAVSRASGSSFFDR